MILLQFCIPNFLENQPEIYGKLTEVRIRPLPLPVSLVFVMNLELCDFRVTK